MKAGAPQDPRALIVVGKSSSHCSACGKETRATRFHSHIYTGVLGLSVEEDMTIEPGGKRWVLLDSRERYLSVLLLEPRLAPSSFLKLDVTYYTDDVWRTVAEWKGKGVVLIGEPEATRWGMTAEFEDPDGNRISVLHSTRTLD